MYACYNKQNKVVGNRKMQLCFEIHFYPIKCQFLFTSGEVNQNGVHRKLIFANKNNIFSPK